MAGADGAIYGVASQDRECPAEWYRYTVAVEAEAWHRRADAVDEELYTLHIPASEWIAFALHDFGAQYGGFWQENPYSLIQRLGWEFNTSVGLHLDVYGSSYCSDHDSMEFWMPVRRPR